jgi:hypothetical protein
VAQQQKPVQKIEQKNKYCFLKNRTFVKILPTGINESQAVSQRFRKIRKLEPQLPDHGGIHGIIIILFPLLARQYIRKRRLKIITKAENPNNSL